LKNSPDIAQSPQCATLNQGQQTTLLFGGTIALEKDGNILTIFEGK